MDNYTYYEIFIDNPWGIDGQVVKSGYVQGAIYQTLTNSAIDDIKEYLLADIDSAFASVEFARYPVRRALKRADYITYEQVVEKLYYSDC